MDWKRVKSILIALLLVTNLLLGFNIYSHYMEQRQRENQGIGRAIGLMSNQGRGMTFAMAVALPPTMNHYQFQRDVETEEAFAAALLGAGTISQVHGGGVYEYTSPLGTVRFSRGGVKLDIYLYEAGEDLEACVRRLGAAGMEIKDAFDLAADGRRGTITQRLEGHPVENGVLELSLETGMLWVSGQWIMSTLTTVTPLAATRAELLLALDVAMTAAEIPPKEQILSISPGYLAESTDGRDIIVEPVWIVEMARGRIALNLRSKTSLALG